MRRTLFLVLYLAGPLCYAGEPVAQPWSSAMLQDMSVWPHGSKDSPITADRSGFRVEVPPGRGYFIAYARVLLPKDAGRVRVRVSELGGGATWFVNLRGEVREAGKVRHLVLADAEPQAGTFTFDMDPRSWTRRDEPLQLNLGVKGQPGAFVRYGDIEFLPPAERKNRHVRKSFQPGQKDLAVVERMPNLPEPYHLVDWRERARAFDRLVFDINAKGRFLPLVWMDDSRVNMDAPTFGLPTYVGDNRMGPGRSSAESITCLGAVLSGTLVGIDKRQQEHDYVAMCEAWFNRKNGLNLVLNNMQAETSNSFWYVVWPHVLFYALADRYPGHAHLDPIMHSTADRWREACLKLCGSDGVPDFNHTSFNFRTGQAADNNRWKEPDAAAGVAWLQYMAWVRYHDPRYLDAADGCLKFLDRCTTNPYYEDLLPWGVVAAARMNAEQGRAHDVDRLLAWCFDISDTRGGWGVSVGNWGGYDCDGLVGEVEHLGGYVAAGNTFIQIGALVPLARYDTRYARAIGKWMLNSANSARMFYDDAVPASHQTSGFWRDDPNHAIAYEGVRHRWHGVSPFVMGDPIVQHWGPATDRAVYGSAMVGMPGAIVRPTNVERILQLDCLATDFFHGEAFPTFLYFNPYEEAREVRLDVGREPCDVYDAAAHRFVVTSAVGKTRLKIPGDSAVVAVLVPAGQARTRDGRQLRCGGGVIDFQCP